MKIGEEKTSPASALTQVQILAPVLEVITGPGLDLPGEPVPEPSLELMRWPSAGRVGESIQGLKNMNVV